MANQILAGAVINASMVIAGVDASNPPYVGPPPPVLVVSSPYAPGNENTVFIYNLADMSESPVELAPFDNEHPDPWTQNFGSSLTVTDKYIVVGSSDDNDNNPYSGSVYVYDRTDISAQPTKLLAFDGDEYDVFGFKLTYSDGYIFVGARGDDNEFGNGSGAVYAYDENDLSAQPIKLIENTTQFGGSLSAHNGKLAVGSEGGVYVYDINDLTASPTQVGSSLPEDVILSGSKLFVGLPSDNNGTGQVEAYNINDLTASPTQITAPDGSSGYRFGSDLAVNSTNLYIGSYKDSDNSGSFYVYNLADLSAQPTKITAPDGSSGDFFSRDIVVDDDYVVVGAYGYDSGSYSQWDGTGAIYVYNAKDLSATPVKVVETTGHNDRFGLHMAIGKPYVAPPPTYIFGAAIVGSYVQAYNANDLSPATTITSPNGINSSDAFGSSITVKGTQLFISAHEHNDGISTQAGAVYVYDITNLSAAPTELVANDPTVNKFFGIQIVASGDKLYVGAYGDNSNTGAVYVYDISNLSAAPTKLTPFDGASGDFFGGSGGSISVNSNNLFVGSRGDDDRGNGSGSVYVYDINDLSTQPTKLTAFDGEAVDSFGRSVVSDNNYLVISGHGDDNNGVQQDGSIYVYDANNLSATPTKITSAEGIQYGRFGYSLSLGEGKLVVGMDDRGAVYVYDINNMSAAPTKLTPQDGTRFFFGTYDISVREGKIVVGQPKDNDNEGSIHVYDISNLSAAPTKLTPLNGNSGDKFGQGLY